MTTADKSHELVIQNGTVVDGSGEAKRQADVAIDADRISAIGPPGSLKGARTIDATGRVVSPGFFDIHSHADYTLLVDGRAHSCVCQGITSVVTGNCGHGVAPVTPLSRDLVCMNNPGWSTKWEVPVSWDSFGSYLEVFRDRGCGVNVYPLVAHGALRLAVAGFEDREIKKGEMDAMRSMADEAMASGAVGFSTGLEYAPGIAADREELARVCEPVGDHDGIYTTHCRNRAEGMTDAAEESVYIAEHAGTRLQMSHFVRRPWAPKGTEKRAMDVLEQARQRGIRTFCDVFPFDYGPTPLGYLLPLWARAGTRSDIADRLASPAIRSQIFDELSGNFKAALEGDIAETMYVSVDGHDGSMIGRTLGEIAKDGGESVAETAIALLARAGENFYNVTIVERWVEWDDLTAALGDPNFFIMGDGASGGLDGSLSNYAFTLSDWGYAPAYLGRFVRDMGVTTLEAAIAKMTSGPATQVGIEGRGTIAEGNFADLVIFDLDTIGADITPGHLKTVPTGIEQVLVNGDFVVRDGQPTNHRPGEIGKRI